MTRSSEHDPIAVLTAARKVADFASNQGLAEARLSKRLVCNHMGAVLADTVLQAGLRYSTVVRPRVTSILTQHPQADKIAALVGIISAGETGAFLQWSHHQKIARFERIVAFLDDEGVRDVEDLKQQYKTDGFGAALQKVNGVGPKSVDYLACLIGIESIAVDRHIRKFAMRVGVDADDYGFLKHVFCYAADLLSVSRREFDGWIWQVESLRGSRQLSFAI
ncbi:hypothetical protein [Aliiroseovarius crassostreae]|uniref:hypothetical protein n=1 Tax=Aliiroseovarius crassostreae TaxID=154981 RepID=UPI002201F891|nr:hypothetical protein [Aliiroseovarius crassostreae]UWP97807.1 hypothetical protein K3X53_10510 [Aliiroseovarius crassostreae]